jgi:hypothetical protein
MNDNDSGSENNDAVTMTEMIASQEAPQLSDLDKLFKHAITHFIVAISVLALWAAADTWYLTTGLGLANFLSVSTAAVAGAVVSTLIHEWFHYAGAKFSAAQYRIPEKAGLFVYDWDFGANSEQQFYTMSYAGQLGSLLAVVLLVMLVPVDNSGRAMLIAAAIGSGVFGASIEWPVLKRTRISHNPLAELAKITPEVFKRSLGIGVAAALIIWLIIG